MAGDAVRARVASGAGVLPDSGRPAPRRPVPAERGVLCAVSVAGGRADDCAEWRGHSVSARVLQPTLATPSFSTTQPVVPTAVTPAATWVTSIPRTTVFALAFLGDRDTRCTEP